MDRRGRDLRKKARQVGLDVTGPYTGGLYCIFEMSSGDLLSPPGGVSPDDVAAEIERHQGVPRLADIRRRRWL